VEAFRSEPWSTAALRGTFRIRKKVIPSVFVKAKHASHTKPKAIACQQKSFPIGNDSLEVLVAKYLRFHLESKSFGVFASELGISKGMLSRYVNAQQSMTLGTLQKIQTAMHVSLEDVFGRNAVRKAKMTPRRGS